MKNKSPIVHRQLSILLILISLFSILLFSGCQNAAKSVALNEYGFPETMVGIWAAPEALQGIPDWHLKFEADGSISKIYHRVFGQMVISEGGVYREGEDEGTYMVATLGDVESSYDPRSRKINVKIAIDEYEMKFLSGVLEGHMYDTFIGRPSTDGKTWTVENRNYGWLKGADEPDMDLIDKYPDIIVFTKIDPNDLAGQAVPGALPLDAVHTHSSPE